MSTSGVTINMAIIITLARAWMLIATYATRFSRKEGPASLRESPSRIRRPRAGPVDPVISLAALDNRDRLVQVTYY